jgi:hypothetical protein
MITDGMYRYVSTLDKSAHPFVDLTATKNIFGGIQQTCPSRFKISKRYAWMY